MSMKYINRKNESGEYVLNDKELIDFLEKLAKKYPLRTTKYAGYFAKELERLDEYAKYTLSCYMSDEAPIRVIEDDCWFDDYNFSSLYLYEDDVVNIKTDFRKYMISKFGKEYFDDLKANLKESRDNEIEDSIKEITDKYDQEWFALEEELDLDR